MEEYLENMKYLRSYMNDLEEDAAKRSAEEQQQRTAIDAHDAEIALVSAQMKRSREEVDKLAEARAQVCVVMAEKQGRIAALEVEGATLQQSSCACGPKGNKLKGVTFFTKLDLWSEYHQAWPWDTSKIQAVVDLPTPGSIRARRGFLGLAGSYRKFINIFAAIAAPFNKNCIQGRLYMVLQQLMLSLSSNRH